MSLSVEYMGIKSDNLDFIVMKSTFLKIEILI